MSTATAMSALGTTPSAAFSPAPMPASACARRLDGRLHPYQRQRQRAGEFGGIDSAQLGAYARHDLGSFHLRGGASGTFDTIDTSRMVAFPGFAEEHACAFNGYTGQVFGEFAYSMAINQVALEPFAGLAYVHVQRRARSWKAAASPRCPDRPADRRRLFLARPARRHHVDTVQRHRAGAAALSDTGSTLSATSRRPSHWRSRAPARRFSVSGVPIAADTAVIEAGLDWRITAADEIRHRLSGPTCPNRPNPRRHRDLTWDF